ncbi:MAG: ATP-grasp domain-containing protein [Lachnospiraceae bacterium]|nr:ATP-grasp domain-containing protein [Lachnospiraceae bacterium]
MKIWCLSSNLDDKLEKYGMKIKKGKNYELIFIDYTSIEIKTGEEPTLFCMGEKLELPDAFWLWTTNTDVRIIENMLLSLGVKSITNLDEQTVVRSKVATCNRMAKAGLPIPRTFVFFNHPSKEQIKEKFSYPFVIKPDNGLGGEGVALIHNDKELDDYLSDLKYGVAYLAQEYISASKGRDLRVIMLKGEILLGVLRQASNPDEFRSNVHVGGTAELYEVDEKARELCKKAAALFDLKLLGLDLMFTEDGFVFSEANSFPGLSKELRDKVTDIVIEDFIQENKA